MPRMRIAEGSVFLDKAVGGSDGLVERAGISAFEQNLELFATSHVYSHHMNMILGVGDVVCRALGITRGNTGKGFFIVID